MSKGLKNFLKWSAVVIVTLVLLGVALGTYYSYHEIRMQQFCDQATQLGGHEEIAALADELGITYGGERGRTLSIGFYFLFTGDKYACTIFFDEDGIKPESSEMQLQRL